MTPALNLSIYDQLRVKLYIVVPLLLILICPPLVILFWYTATFLEGSLWKLSQLILEQGFFTTLYQIGRPIFFGTPQAWKILAFFAGSQLLFMKIIPGPIFYGPVTPQGNQNRYKANGLACYSLTLFLFCLTSFYLKWFSPTLIYDHLGPLLGAVNLFSLLFCFVLYLKGRFFPSSSDAGCSHNFIFDYYWGTELYPKILGWDVKLFTNCRFGMMAWPLIILSFAAKQYQNQGFLSDSMLVSVFLQLVYITKFFIWETGYLRSLDIMHDRAGYYICWGCLVWVPGIYTLPTLYLVDHPNQLGLGMAMLIAAAGLVGIISNYLADRQRQLVRLAEGKCQVWGKPATIVKANYLTERGEAKTNILLASGWWGISRHFHYVPELIGAFCWSLPALFTHFLPYFYVVFLFCLLMDRAFRDDKRCARKYGKDWEAYCHYVPYKIIPYFV